MKLCYLHLKYQCFLKTLGHGFIPILVNIWGLLPYKLNKNRLLKIKTFLCSNIYELFNQLGYLIFWQILKLHLLVLFHTSTLKEQLFWIFLKKVGIPSAVDLFPRSTKKGFLKTRPVTFVYELVASSSR